MTAAPPRSVLVVGASAAGLGTAEALRRRGYEGRLTVLDAGAAPPYDRPPLSKQVLAGQWEPDRAQLRPPEALAALDVEFRFREAAVSLDVGRRTVRTASGRTLRADVIVLACGLVPRALPGAAGLDGVHTLRTLEEALALRAALGQEVPVVVVGDGVLGSEIAATCVGLGRDTTLVGPQPAPMADQFGTRVASALAALHRRNGVRLVHGTTVTALSRKRGAVTGVRLPTGETLPAGVVVTAVGCRPATDWLADSGLDLDDGVRCDARCRAAPGIYAVGDLARWHHEGTGTTLRLENRTNAGTQAVAVAANILGADRPYTPLPYFWTDQFGVRVQGYGIPGHRAETRVIEGDPDEAGGGFVVRRDLDGHPTAVLGWNMPKRARTHATALLGPRFAAPARTGPPSPARQRTPRPSTPATSASTASEGHR
ncbi:FAD-dependent oxidoreductase [Streptomyces sp. NPDC005438]|uniref:NAD(P)/FAD-dependent oxidoreductase n=1 Tax=Streptomyces sp. NPDC005438 TaxID=3156880 RepID=UPI0033B1FE50